MNPCRVLPLDVLLVLHCGVQAGTVVGITVIPTVIQSRVTCRISVVIFFLGTLWRSNDWLCDSLVSTLCQRLVLASEVSKIQPTMHHPKKGDRLASFYSEFDILPHWPHNTTATERLVATLRSSDIDRWYLLSLAFLFLLSAYSDIVDHSAHRDSMFHSSVLATGSL